MRKPSRLTTTSIPGAKYGIDGVDGLKTGSSPEGASTILILSSVVINV